MSTPNAAAYDLVTDRLARILLDETAATTPDADDLRDQILEKVLMVRSLQRSSGRQSITPWSDGRIDLD